MVRVVSAGFFAFLFMSIFLSSAGAVEVEEVIGGDRYRLDTGEEVRLAGVDTRLINDPGRRGASFTEEAMTNIAGLFKTAEVRIEDAEGPPAKDGQRLVYLYTIETKKEINTETAQTRSTQAETLVNLEIIRRGYGKPQRGYRGRYRDAFLLAARDAKKTKAGLWRS